jgi:hypothetical protein
MKTRLLGLLGVLVLGVVSPQSTGKQPHGFPQALAGTIGSLQLAPRLGMPPAPGSCCDQDEVCNNYRGICEYAGPDIPTPDTPTFGVAAPSDGGTVSKPAKHAPHPQKKWNGPQSVVRDAG